MKNKATSHLSARARAVNILRDLGTILLGVVLMFSFGASLNASTPVSASDSLVAVSQESTPLSPLDKADQSNEWMTFLYVGGGLVMLSLLPLTLKMRKSTFSIPSNDNKDGSSE